MNEKQGTQAFDFQAIVEHAPALLWSAQPNGALDYVCPKVLAYFARTFAQMIEWGWAEVVHPEDLPKVGEAWSMALETGALYEIPFRIRRAQDGTYRMHLTRGLPQRDASGKIIRWFGVTYDIEGQAGR
jgi:PAS domain S-box-containing protein